MRSNQWSWSAAALLLVSSFACSDGGAGVGLAFTTRNPAAAAQAGDSTVVVRGNDTLVIKSVDIVLREVELERIEDLADCPDSSGGDDACEEFTVGVQLVSLPLGNGTDKVVTVNVAAGIYDEVEFAIHKPEDDGSDAAFIAAHPDFADVSIRVTGTLSRAGTRTSFVYTTDLNQEQEVNLNPPLDVTSDGAVNLTIRLDIATWFVNGTAIIDPATANNGGANENVVQNNIRASIDAFHDDDSDGLDDDGEDDDGGSGHSGPGV